MNGLDSLATTPGLDFGETGYWGLLLKTILYLALISVILYISLRWVMPKLLRWKIPGSGSMTIVDRLPLGGTRSICVIRAAGHYYLVGVTDGQIQMLEELEAKDIESRYSAAAKLAEQERRLESTSET